MPGALRLFTMNIGAGRAGPGSCPNASALSWRTSCYGG